MQVETLECRRLMAVQLPFVEGGVLNILGDGDDDVVQVWQAGSGVHVKVNDVLVTPQLTGMTGVTGLFIDLGDGNNDLTVEGETGPGISSIPAIILTGTGNDGVSIINANTQHAVAISTGGGDDFVIVQDLGSYGTAVMAGAGADCINVWQASSNNNQRTMAFGGSGEDQLFGPGINEVIPPSGYCDLHGDQDADIFIAYNTATAQTRIFGGSGEDIAEVYVDGLQRIKVSNVQDLTIHYI